MEKESWFKTNECHTLSKALVLEVRLCAYVVNTNNVHNQVCICPSNLQLSGYDFSIALLSSERIEIGFLEEIFNLFKNLLYPISSPVVS